MSEHSKDCRSHWLKCLICLDSRLRLLSNKLPKGKYLSCKDILMDLQTNFLDGHHYGDKETKDNIINIV